MPTVFGKKSPMNSLPRVLPAVIAALSASGGTLLLPATAQAQLEEVVVTARVYRTSMKDCF